jgi:hypothetical protein
MAIIGRVNDRYAEVQLNNSALLWEQVLTTHNHKKDGNNGNQRPSKGTMKSFTAFKTG